MNSPQSSIVSTARVLRLNVVYNYNAQLTVALPEPDVERSSPSPRLEGRDIIDDAPESYRRGASTRWFTGP